MTILNYSTFDWLAGTQPLNISILQPSGAEVDKLKFVTELPCLLGLTVYIHIYIYIYIYIHIYTDIQGDLFTSYYATLLILLQLHSWLCKTRISKIYQFKAYSDFLISG